MAQTRAASGSFFFTLSIAVFAAIVSAERADEKLSGSAPPAQEAAEAAKPAEAVKPDWHAALGLSPDQRRADVGGAYQRLFPRLRAHRDTGPVGLNAYIAAQKAYDALSHSYMREDALNYVPYWSEVEYLRSDDALRKFTELEGAGSSRLRVVFVTEKPDQKVYEAFDTAVRLYGRARVAQVCPTSIADSTGAAGKFFSSLRVRESGVVIFDPLAKAKNITYRRSRLVDDLEHTLDYGGERKSEIARVQELNPQSYESRCGNADSNRCQWSLVVATDEAFEQQGDDLRKVMSEFSAACKKMQGDDRADMGCFWLRLDKTPESEQWRAFLNRHSSEPLPIGKPTAFALRRSATGPGISVAPEGEALPETIHSLQQMSGKLSTDEHARWWTFDGPSIYSLGLVRWFDKMAAVEPQAISKLPPFPRWQPRAEPDMALPDVAMRYFQSFKDMPPANALPLAIAAGIASLALPLSLCLCYSRRSGNSLKEPWVV